MSRVLAVLVAGLGLACSAVAPAPGSPPPVEAPGHTPRPLAAETVPPTSGAGAARPAVLGALEKELARARAALGAEKPAAYFVAYEVFEREDTTISGSYGALGATSTIRRRQLDTDVRVGDHHLDSTHPLRSSGFDFGSFAEGAPSALPLADDEAAVRAVAWSDTLARYREAAERFTKIRTQQKVKVAEDDDSDDFSRETPQVFYQPEVDLPVDMPSWEERVRRLSARFRGHPTIYESGVDLSALTETRAFANSEGTSVQVSAAHVRVTVHGSTRADDGMELERFETFDAHGFAGLPDEAVFADAADRVMRDLEDLRRAPLAEPFVGPAILEGRAAGVFFHEIFGHRVEGHRQKREEEGQTFAKKIGQPVMPAFISVWDDPRMARLGGVDLNGFYRFDDEGVPAARASLVEAGVLRGFLLGRSPTRGFSFSNGHGRRQEGREVVPRQGNLVVEASRVVSLPELREGLRREARRQGKPFGLLFKDISGGFTNTARGGMQAFKVLPILVYRVYVDGRPDELLRGADLVGTPLTSLTKILAAGDDPQTFNGYCGAESGFVPVSATSPSLLVEQIEVERKDKGEDKPPVLPAPGDAP